MFNFFKKKDPAEALAQEYKDLMAQAYKISHTDRKAADALTAKAEEVMKKLEQLRSKQ